MPLIGSDTKSLLKSIDTRLSLLNTEAGGGQSFWRIRSGDIPGTEMVLLNLHNVAVDNSGYEIMAPNVPVNTLDITMPTVARTMICASTSALDTTGGTGARSVLIIGLDNGYNEISEVVAMNGVTATTATTLEFLRINSLYVLGDAGSLKTNQGNIWITDSADSFTGAGLPVLRVYHGIDVNWNVSTVGVYTIPINKIGIINQFKYISDTTVTKPMLFRLDMDFTNTTNGLGVTRCCELDLVGSQDFENTAFPNAPAKTDLLWYANLSAPGTNKITLFISMVLIDA